MLKQVEVAEIFEKTGALLTGHFLLTSGLHSSNYFQCAQVMQYPKYASLICKDLAARYINNSIDLVISPALGGILVGQEVAKCLDVRAIFAERENGIMTLRRGFSIRENERVLIVEDVLTTGKSIGEVVSVVEQCNAKVCGIGVLVDRSNGKAPFSDVNSVIQIDASACEPKECALCREGIPLEKPGSRKINGK
jgi:orotate phosphoribosyltransferase